MNSEFSCATSFRPRPGRRVFRKDLKVLWPNHFSFPNSLRIAEASFAIGTASEASFMYCLMKSSIPASCRRETDGSSPADSGAGFGPAGSTRPGSLPPASKSMTGAAFRASACSTNRSASMTTSATARYAWETRLGVTMTSRRSWRRRRSSTGVKSASPDRMMNSPKEGCSKARASTTSRAMVMSVELFLCRVSEGQSTTSNAARAKSTR